MMLYPMGAVVQIFVVPNHWLGGILAGALCGLAISNAMHIWNDLKRLEAAPPPVAGTPQDK